MAQQELQVRECLEREICLLFDEGVITGAVIWGIQKSWRVLVETERGRVILIAEKSKKPREFARLDTAAAWLRDLGVMRFVVDQSVFGGLV